MKPQSIRHTFDCGCLGIDITARSDGYRQAFLWTRDAGGRKHRVCDFADDGSDLLSDPFAEFANAVVDALDLLDVLTAHHPSDVACTYRTWLDARTCAADKSLERIRCVLREKLDHNDH